MQKNLVPESTARKIAFSPHINIGVFTLEKDWSLDSLAGNFKKALSSGKVFGSEGLAINIAVYDKNVDVEFLPLYCNWIASNVLPKYDTTKDTFVEPYLPHNKIGIMHLAAGIWSDKKDMRVNKDIKIKLKQF